MRTSSASLLLLLCVVGGTFALTFEEARTYAERTQKFLAASDANQATLQQVFNGLFEENHLADPSTILSCIDSTSAAQIVTFLGSFLQQASNILTVTAAVNNAIKFSEGLNPAVVSCLSTNAELLSLSTVYNVDSITPAFAISYLTSHTGMIVGDVQALNKLWKSKNFNGVGNSAGTFTHDIINGMSGNKKLASSPIVQSIEAFLAEKIISHISQREENALSVFQGHLETMLDSIKEFLSLSNVEIVQQYYNGMYAQQNLPNPAWVSACYSAGAAADFTVFQPSFLKKASSMFTIESAFNDLQTFTTQQGNKYPELNICTQNYEAETQAFSNAVGIKHPETVNETIKAYINANLKSTNNDFGAAYKSWTAQNFFQSGKQVSEWTKKALAKN